MKYALRIISSVFPEMYPEAADKYIVDFLDTGDIYEEIVLSEETEEAKLFDSTADAMKFWRTVSQKFPVRHDGYPNRPMTAFNVTITKVQEGEE